MTKFDEINAEVSEIKEKLTSLKKSFETIIKDKSIPLEDRFNMFCKAPFELKNHESYIQDIEAWQSKFKSGFNDDNPFYFQRHEEVILSEVIGNLSYLIHDDISKEDKTFNGEVFTEQDLINFKEEVLEKNLGSFNLDW